MTASPLSVPPLPSSSGSQPTDRPVADSQPVRGGPLRGRARLRDRVRHHGDGRADGLFRRQDGSLAPRQAHREGRRIRVRGLVGSGQPAHDTRGRYIYTSMLTSTCPHENFGHASSVGIPRHWGGMNAENPMDADNAGDGGEKTRDGDFPRFSRRRGSGSEGDMRQRPDPRLPRIPPHLFPMPVAPRIPAIPPPPMPMQVVSRAPFEEGCGTNTERHVRYGGSIANAPSTT